MAKSKFTYAKCPYCKNEYREDLFSGRYTLLHLATNGNLTEDVARCLNCKKRFKIKIHISYYGSKINEVIENEIQS